MRHVIPLTLFTALVTATTATTADTGLQCKWYKTTTLNNGQRLADGSSWTGIITHYGKAYCRSEECCREIRKSDGTELEAGCAPCRDELVGPADGDEYDFTKGLCYYAEEKGEYKVVCLCSSQLCETDIKTTPTIGFLMNARYGTKKSQEKEYICAASFVKPNTLGGTGYKKVKPEGWYAWGRGKEPKEIEDWEAEPVNGFVRCKYGCGIRIMWKMSVCQYREGSADEDGCMVPDEESGNFTVVEIEGKNGITMTNTSSLDRQYGYVIAEGCAGKEKEDTRSELVISKYGQAPFHCHDPRMFHRYDYHTHRHDPQRPRLPEEFIEGLPILVRVWFAECRCTGDFCTIPTADYRHLKAFQDATPLVVPRTPPITTTTTTTKNYFYYPQFSGTDGTPTLCASLLALTILFFISPNLDSDTLVLCFCGG